MLVLLGFAVLAGAGTALSPCVLPVLPALLSAGGVGGRRRPLGIVLGLSITFTVTIVGVAKVVDGVGLGSDPLRDVAIVVLLVFGVALLAPSVADRIEAPLSRLARFGPRTRGDGFWSGMLVGGALGFVYTPCASPILAAVISVSAASGKTVVIALAYALGSALVLLALTLGGRRLFDRVRKAGRGPMLQRALGAIMILTAVAIIANLDVNFDQFVAQAHPRRQPHRRPGVLGNRHQPPARNQRSPGQVRDRQRLLGVRRLGLAGQSRAGERQPVDAACHRARAQSARPGAANSPKRRTGSTRPATAAVAAPPCAGAWCSSTSGPTRASTASARSPI